MDALTKLGKYTLIEKIASGGMAELYLAHMTGMGGFVKTVAIKKIHKHLSGDSEFTEMFINEARIAARLSHQNIIQTHDFGVVQGTFFLAMEFIHGRDLKTVMKRCERLGIRFPFALALFLTQQVLKGLDYAHRLNNDAGRPLGVVHRDMSPQNIMVSFEGEVKIADFGIAKIGAEEGALSGDEGFRGKVSYMSPEQATGQAVDARSDIFSVGVVLFELLTGRRPFEGENDFETLRLLREAPVPSLRDVDPTIPAEVDRIVQIALSRDPDGRYRTAREMLTDLQRFCVSRQLLDQTTQLAAFVQQLFSRDKTVDGVEVTPLPTDPSWAVSTPADQADEAARGVLAQWRSRPAAWLLAGAALVALALVLAVRGGGERVAPPQGGPTALAMATATVPPEDRSARTLLIRSVPGGAEVFLGDDFQGLTPLRVGPLPFGEYDLKLRLGGELRHRATLVVGPASNSEIRIDLRHGS